METVTLYVDGACPSNGKEGASMYWSMGVKFNGKPHDFQFYTSKYKSPHKFLPSDYDVAVDHKSTNQVAELLAINTALTYISQMASRYSQQGKVIKDYLQFVIFSDSEYAIGATGNNKVKANKELVILIRSMLSDLSTLYGNEFINVCKCDRTYIVEFLGH